MVVVVEVEVELSKGILPVVSCVQVSSLFQVEPWRWGGLLRSIQLSDGIPSGWH